jgi:hypothetical protein
MSKRISRIISFVVAAALLISPIAALADHDPAILHGTVFRDADGNGTLDPGEVGLGSVTVSLFESGGTILITSTTTDTDGAYAFTNLEPEDYVVEVEVLVGYDDSALAAVPFNVDGSTPIPIVNFGKTPLGEGSISGTVYNDLNRNGLFDDSDGDKRLPNVSLRLIDDAGVKIPATTNALGEYEFTGLVAGSYTVIETDPEDFFSTTPNTVVVNLSEEDSMNVVVDFGDFLPTEGEFPKIDLLLMKFFDISLLEFQALRGVEGWGYGNIAKAYFIAQLSDTALGEILGMRETMGWGNIMKAVLGRAGLKGYNLGLIVSGRTVPNSIQKLIDGCGSISTPEEVQELYGMGANNGAIKKACRLASEVDDNFETLVEALGLLRVHSQKQVREMLRAGNTNQFTNGSNSNHGPPPCKGKNKYDDGCN